MSFHNVISECQTACPGLLNWLKRNKSSKRTHGLSGTVERAPVVMSLILNHIKREAKFKSKL